MKRLFSILILVLSTAVLLTACGGGGGGGAPVAKDTTPPSATALPATDSTINGSVQIIISFDESMATDSLIVGGDMAAESDGGKWSTTAHANDTLTISPNAAWTEGNGRSLTIQAKDLADNPLSALSLSYTVDRTPLVATASPVSGTLINAAKSIVITFNESANPSSLGLGGSLAAASNGGLWSSATHTNDTLTVSPASAWSNGSGTLLVDISDVVGNSMTTLNLNYTVDAILPTANVSPVNGAILANTTPIVITFSESMATGSLSVTGMASKNYTWSKTVATNDTLTISPTTEWDVGASRALTVYAEDLVGNPITVNLTYDVAVAYVRDSDGNDANPGTRSQPMKTISAAIARADSLYTIGEVHVAAGTYNVSAAIEMAEEISLYGGYSPSSWDVRNPLTYVTTIQDTRTSGGTHTTPNAAISTDSGITNKTRIDSFTIQGGGGLFVAAISNFGSPSVVGNIISGGSGSYSTGIFNDGQFNAAPVITSNVINGGNGSTQSSGIETFGQAALVIQRNVINGGSGSHESMGILINGSTDVVQYNTINGGSGQYSVGIFCNWTSSSTIRNNTIDGGTGTSGTTGMENYAASPAIQNNTINGGRPGSGYTTSYGITISNYSTNPSLPQIVNNIIFTSSGNWRYCVSEAASTNIHPATLQNNDLFGCPTALYYDMDGGGSLTTISAMEAKESAEGTTASGNISVSPALVNQDGGDWHLTISSPASVTQGGLDISSQFNDDKDGVIRTAPWSIGAYEFN